MRAYLTPCINDCGLYGQCKLLRTNNYLYAACECKAGELPPVSGSSFSVISQSSRAKAVWQNASINAGATPPPPQLCISY